MRSLPSGDDLSFEARLHSLHAREVWRLIKLSATEPALRTLMSAVDAELIYAEKWLARKADGLPPPLPDKLMKAEANQASQGKASDISSSPLLDATSR